MTKSEEVILKLASKHLLGARIKSIRYMSESEANRYGWSKRPLVLVLSNGVEVLAMRDEEGNNAGALATAEHKGILGHVVSNYPPLELGGE